MQVQTDDLEAHVPEEWNRHKDPYLGSGKYYVSAATPGKHEYSTQGEATDRLTLEIEEGETYFVRCNIGMGVMSGRANLSPSDEALFAKKSNGLKLWSGPKGGDN